MKPISVLLLNCCDENDLGKEVCKILASVSEAVVCLHRRDVPSLALSPAAGGELAAIAAGHQFDVVLLSLSPEQVRQAEPMLSACRRTFDSLALIVVTEVMEPEELFNLIRHGATDFVTSPLHKCELLPRIWRAIERHQQSRTAEHKLKESLGLNNLIGKSRSFRQAVEKIPEIARCDSAILIVGETGTGKEVFARAIHYLGHRAHKPFVPVNCGAIPTELVENELFGHEKGAFTGASHTQTGLVEEADGGTLFLDEVDSLPLNAQVKLLRFLQDKEYRSLGSAKARKADVRIIAAANGDLEESVRAGRLRHDLYYRLNVIPLRLPPLRERREDIPALAQHFLARFTARQRKTGMSFSIEAINLMINYEWPGNVRELEHIVERAVVLTGHGVLQSEDIDLPRRAASPPSITFREAKSQLVAQFERSYIQQLLTTYAGNVTKAAQAAKKNRRALWHLIHKYGINVHSYRERTTKA